MSTRAPEIIEALYELVVAEFGPDVQVVDGPNSADIAVADAIGLAVNAEAGEIAPVQAASQFGLGSYRGELDLACLLQSSSGSDDFPRLRRQAYALLRRFPRVLAELAKRPDVVDARIPNHTYTPIRDNQAFTALIQFVVRIDTYEKE